MARQWDRQAMPMRDAIPWLLMALVYVAAFAPSEGQSVAELGKNYPAAVAIHGERLTAASAVRCAGNTLLLHGTLHTPPYRIAAIGNPDTIAVSLVTQPGMDRLAAASETFGLGLEIETGTVDAGGDLPTPQFDVAEPAEAA